MLGLNKVKDYRATAALNIGSQVRQQQEVIAFSYLTAYS